MDRALRARDNRDELEFHLWSAVSIELLGKAALAHIHPVLVADPSKFPSLLAACGRQTTTDPRSITAGTVFERLHHISQQFDDSMRRFCLVMAERRNSELHSGETPLQGVDHRSWVPQFWKVADVLLREQNRSFDDWVGMEEASRARAILADSAELLRQSVLARIGRRKAEYDTRCPLGSAERLDAAGRAAARPLPSRYYSIADAEEEIKCPACSSKAWLFGFEWEEQVIDRVVEGSSPFDFDCYDIVRTTFGAEEFRCVECGLTLEGRDELEIVGLPLVFEREDVREPQYEPEYGNE
jgi:hypothetical protein